MCAGGREPSVRQVIFCGLPATSRQPRSAPPPPVAPDLPPSAGAGEGRAILRNAIANGIKRKEILHQISAHLTLAGGKFMSTMTVVTTGRVRLVFLASQERESWR